MENNILDSGLFNEGPSISFHERVEQILNDGFHFSIGECLSEGFDIFKQNPAGFLGFTLLLTLVNVVPEIATTTFGEASGSIISVVTNLLTVPLGVGFSLVAKRIYHEEEYDFSNFFDGFQHTMPLIIASILTILATVLGLILLVIPGIYLAVAFSWVNSMIIFAGQDSVEAMSISRKVLSKNWFQMAGFLLVLLLVAFAGLLAFGIGIFVTIPIISCASYVAYEKVIGANLK